MSLRDRAFLKSRTYQGQQWRADRLGAHPDLLEFERAFVRRLAKLGVPVFANEMVRSPERQNELLARGVTKAKAGQSAHQFGCAVDIVHSTMAWELSPKEWQLLGHIGRELATQRGLALVWGGDDPGEADSFDWDPAHWEIRDWKSEKGNFPWPIMK